MASQIITFMVSHLLNLWLIFITFMVHSTFMMRITFMGDTEATRCNIAIVDDMLQLVERVD